MKRMFILYLAFVLFTVIAMDNPCMLDKSKQQALNNALQELLQAANPSWQEIKDLIEKGAEINTKTQKENETAIIVAARAKNAEIVSFLLKRGADANAKNGTNNTALRWAATFGCSRIVRMLTEARVEVDCRDKYSNTPLMWAALILDNAAKAEVITLLLESGADRTAVDNEGNTVLAIAQGDQPIIDLLTKKIKLG